MEELGKITETNEIDEKAADTPTPCDENAATEEAVAVAEALGEEEEKGTDYAALALSDMRELISLFPHLKGKKSVSELENPLRYAALRDLGLTPREAYLATASHTAHYDNRSHLRSAVPIGAGAMGQSMSARELEEARELFSGLSDRDIQKLYKRVTK
jgi:hypothetical protein